MTRDVQEPGDDERWAQAESILAGRPSDAARGSLRRRRTSFLWFLGGLLVLIVGAGLLVGLLVAGQQHQRAAEPAGWQTVAGLVLAATGLVCAGVGFFRVFKGGSWNQAWRSPTVVLSRAQQRHLLDQVRGRRPADPERLALARDLAVRMERLPGRFLPLWLGIVLMNVGNALQRPGPVRVWLTGVLLAMFVVLLVVAQRQLMRYRRFLAENPAPED